MPSGGPPDAVVWSGEVPPKIPFTATDTEVVLDGKSLCGLPWDADQDGVRAFRALLFPKGKVMHVPDMPGRYVVDGEWVQQTALVVVHFVESTNRKPELLLSFVDHGMASETQQGMSVETLKLPLLVRKDTYESNVKVAPIEDVSGFTPIAASQAPWSLHLAKTLSNLPMFKQLQIGKPSEMDTYIQKPLSERIKDIVHMAREAIATELKVAMRQDAGVAQRRKAVLNAKLNAMQATIEERFDAYEPRLTQRIIKLSDTAVAPADVDMVSLHSALASTPTPPLLRSRLLNAIAPPRRPDSAADPSADAAAAGDAGDGSAGDGSGDDAEGSAPAGLPAGSLVAATHDHELVETSSEDESSDDSQAPIVGKRPRQVPKRLADEVAPRSKKAKAG